MGVKVRERPKGSGVYWIFIDHNGKRKSKKVGDKKTANALAQKTRQRIASGDLGLIQPETSKPLFRDYAEKWLETFIKPFRKPSTYERYKDILDKHVYPVFGNTVLDGIKRGLLRDFLISLHARGYSKSTICLVRDVISGPFGFALDEELVQANPTREILKRINLRRDTAGSVDPLTREEADHFLATCLRQYPEHYPFFLCAFRTGMRLGELLGLHWADIDWHGQFIRLERTFKGGRLGSPKNGKVRRVDLSDQLAGALKALHTVQKREFLKTRAGKQPQIVFHHKGSYMAQNSIRNVFNRVLAKAGLRHVRLHDIRHTYASILLNEGESPVYVKEQLGHSSIKITVDVYGHCMPSSNRAAVNRLDSPHPSATYPQPTKTKSL
ncbi:tyrosine-type recombinase/integrase [Thermodesulfobacteriota bacterium]